MKRILLAVTLTFLAPTAIPQQSEVIDVQLTNLDIVVTDSKGKHVTGLTNQDFQVFEDGAKREITNLSEISRAATATAETIQPAPRRILLIVDNGTIALSARRKVFEATRATLDRLVIGPSDRLAVATISRSVQQRLGWTNDKAEILKTLAAIEKDVILPHPDLAAFERRLDAIMSDADAAASSMGPPTDQNGVPIPGSYTGTPTSGRGNSRGLPPIDFGEFVSSGRNYAASATNETKQTLASLNAALTAFAGLPGGRKIIILAGGGLPLNAADAIFQRIESVREQLDLSHHRGVKGARQASMLMQISPYDVTTLVDSLAAAAKLKGVAFYAVNPEFGERSGGGIGSRAGADQVAEFAVMKGALDGYQRLATATGGAAMIGRPADQVLTEIVNDLDSYYSLGYRATGPLGPKSRISVTVRKGLVARVTLSSGAISRDWEVSDQVVANHLLEPVNPLRISLLTDPPLVQGETKTIPMKILIPVGSLELLREGDHFTAALAVFISLGGPAGHGIEPIPQEKSYRWPESDEEEAKEMTISLSVNLKVGADQDRVSVGVLDRHSGTAGFTRAVLQ